jgi:hypothetical protein
VRLLISLENHCGDCLAEANAFVGVRRDFGLELGNGRRADVAFERLVFLVELLIRALQVLDDFLQPGDEMCAAGRARASPERLATVVLPRRLLSLFGQTPDLDFQALVLRLDVVQLNLEREVSLVQLFLIEVSSLVLFDLQSG